jgi:hypothetical protein
MTKQLNINHPLRKLFKTAIKQSSRFNPILNRQAAEYIEEEILSEFLHMDRLFKIRDASGRRLEDIADMLAEGDIRMNASSYEREFFVHKHIGDYTLFMLGLFPEYLKRRRGKEFIMGNLIIPGGNLSELYFIQGKRSYRIASTFDQTKIFSDLAEHFEMYRNTLEFVRIFLDTAKDETYRKAKDIITQ